MNDIFSKRTKIVATIGPMSESVEAIESLIDNGVNIFRLNTSHSSIDEHREKFERIRQVSFQKNAYCAIMIDLQGPKIRIGNLQNDIELKTGDCPVFAYNACEEGIIPVDYSGIANDIQPQNKILIDDGKISVVVEKIEDNKIYTRVINGGILKSRKGVNIPNATINIEAVTPRDIEYIKFAVENNADYIALSFVRRKEDVMLAKKYVNDLSSDIPIISKLEKPEAIENLEDIIAVSDAIMIARGDLGIELSPIELPICQKRIIDECNRLKKPVIVATQMLENMISNSIPTRAESSDVANAILDGADALMLSAETSVGNYSQEAVKTMAGIACVTENSPFYKNNLEFDMEDKLAITRQAIAFGADKMLKYVDAKAILTFSHFGHSTKLISKLKPSVPIILVTDDEMTCRKMSLYWGVYPYCKKWDDVLGLNLLVKIDNFLTNEVNLKEGDFVIITGSAPKLISGKTNFIRIHRIGA